MPNINIDLDEAACAEIMRRYQLPTKAEAINLALRKLANEPSPSHTPPMKCPSRKPWQCGEPAGIATWTLCARQVAVTLVDSSPDRVP